MVFIPRGAFLVVMGILNKLQEKIEERGGRLRASLNSIIKQLEELGAVKIVLFGSFARDDIDTASDLDLLVVMPSTRSGKEWMSHIYGTVKRDVAADILVFTREELRRNLPVSGLLRSIVRAGKVVYEKKQG